MRVLFWSEYFWPYIGGSEIFAINLLPELQGRGHEFVVVAAHSHSHAPDKTEYNGIPVYRFPVREALANRDIQRIMEIRRQIDEIKRTARPDLVHMNSIGPMDVFHHQTAQAYPLPYLITMQQYIPREALEADSLLRKTLSEAAWVICCSAQTLSEMRAWVPELGSHSSVIHHNVRLPLRRPHALRFDPPTLLCLGRVLDFKGFDLAVSALSIVSARFPRARLVIGGDGPALPMLRQQVATLGLERMVDFLGWVPPEDVPALIDNSTMMIMPSRIEPFGLVALQAAQMARPIVATRVGGLPEVIVSGETGLLVEREDHAALADAITFLLDHPEAAQQMGQAARRRAVGVFSWERYVSAYDEVYRSLMAPANRRSV